MFGLGCVCICLQDIHEDLKAIASKEPVIIQTTTNFACPQIVTNYNNHFEFPKGWPPIYTNYTELRSTDL